MSFFKKIFRQKRRKRIVSIYHIFEKRLDIKGEASNSYPIGLIYKILNLLRNR